MTIIFKLGGSLLTLPDLATRLSDVLAQRIGRNHLFVPGGGATADVVRDWSRIHNLNDEISHWLAIASLDFNNRLLQKLVDWTPVCSREQAMECWASQPKPLILEMEKFMAIEEACPVGAYESRAVMANKLPHSWDVTSDSLAAWTANRWPADELVLVKSVAIPRGLSAKQASEMQLVDAYFPLLASRIPLISWCQLRADSVTIEPWLGSST